MEFFFPEVNKVIDKHAPFKTVRVKGRHLPWIIVQLETLRLGTYMRNECPLKSWNAKSNYYKVSLSQNFYNPCQFWNRLNLVLNRHKKNILNQIQINNEFISNPFF